MISGSHVIVYSRDVAPWLSVTVSCTV